MKLQREVIAVYKFGRPDKRRRDLANLEKAVGDTLVRWGCMDDDSQIVDIRLVWANGDVLPGTASVELTEK